VRAILLNRLFGEEYFVVVLLEEECLAGSVMVVG
jgi:hypothetical protein